MTALTLADQVVDYLHDYALLKVARVRMDMVQKDCFNISVSLTGIRSPEVAEMVVRDLASRLEGLSKTVLAQSADKILNFKEETDEKTDFVVRPGDDRDESEKALDHSACINS